jgi:hypothetical protein
MAVDMPPLRLTHTPHHTPHPTPHTTQPTPFTLTLTPYPSVFMLSVIILSVVALWACRFQLDKQSVVQPLALAREQTWDLGIVFIFFAHFTTDPQWLPNPR